MQREEFGLNVGIEPGPVLLVGLGASGKAALSLLLCTQQPIHAYDRKPWQGERPAGVTFFEGEQIPEEAFAGVKTVVMSPGIDPRPVKAQLDRLGSKAQILGEMGLALRTAQAKWPSTKTVLVTGTNGKSTVTHLCAHLLCSHFQEVFAGGNLGIPLSEMVVQVAKGQARLPQVWVLECSSYQLETMVDVRAQVAMLLNLSPDHLDRYRDIEDYAQTKAKIFDALGPDDLALLDAQDPRTPALAPSVPLTIKVGAEDAPGFRAQPGEAGVLWLAQDAQVPAQTLRLPGQHNQKNAVFALLAARHLGAPLAGCVSALASYEGLAHRMQWVQERHGVLYFNDSKATNIASVRAGLEGFPHDYVLICGGQAKQGDDPQDLAKTLALRCKGLIGIGSSGDHFVKMAKSAAIPAHRCETLEEAVPLAARLAQAGQAVVLSPACASWDQFTSFAERGRVFMDAVARL